MLELILLAGGVVVDAFSPVGLLPEKAGGVEDEGQFRADVNERGENGRKLAEERHDDSGRIDQNGPPEVKHYDAVAATADGEDFNEARQIARHEGDIGAFQSDVCALAHRNPDGRFN